MTAAVGGRMLVRLEDIRVTLSGQAILRGVSGGIPAGKITVVMGTNGAGKSTLLKVLLREVAFSGQLTFTCGHDHSHPTPSQIGYVPQRLKVEANLPLTVRDLFGLALSQKPWFWPGAGLPDAALLDHLAYVRLGREALDRQVERLSGGELQRVLLALALEPKPELLMLDEPASGIDFVDKALYHERIAEINQERGTTVVLVSHDLDLIRKYADHVLWLEGGVVAAEGTPEEVLLPERIAGGRVV